MVIHDVETLYRKIQHAHKKGYRLEIHTIGDKATEVVLDALQKAGVGPSDRPILTQYVRSYSNKTITIYTYTNIYLCD
jgi:predicted amidohydrolase YtcJ